MTANEKRGDYLSGKTKKADAQAVAKPYEPTLDERTAVEAVFARKKQKPPSPYLKLSKKGRVAEISLDHLKAAFVTAALWSIRANSRPVAASQTLAVPS